MLCSPKASTGEGGTWGVQQAVLGGTARVFLYKFDVWKGYVLKYLGVPLEHSIPDTIMKPLDTADG